MGLGGGRRGRGFFRMGVFEGCKGFSNLVFRVCGVYQFRVLELGRRIMLIRVFRVESSWSSGFRVFWFRHFLIYGYRKSQPGLRFEQSRE